MKSIGFKHYTLLNLCYFCFIKIRNVEINNNLKMNYRNDYLDQDRKQPTEINQPFFSLPKNDM